MENSLVGKRQREINDHVKLESVKAENQAPDTKKETKRLRVTVPQVEDDKSHHGRPLDEASPKVPRGAPLSPRPGATYKKGKASDKKGTVTRLLDSYLDVVSDMYYHDGAFSTMPDTANRAEYLMKNGLVPLQKLTTLGMLMSPVRRPMIFDYWSPYEVAVFESAICIYGKQFHTIQKFVRTKSTKEVIDFYYLWKKTSHYGVWKSQMDKSI